MSYQDVQQKPRVVPLAVFIWFIAALLVELLPDSGIGSILTYAAAAYALRGARQTGEALIFLALLILMGSTGGGGARWLVIFAGLSRAVWDTVVVRAPVPRIVWVISIFSGIVVFFAPLSSSIPTVSVFKAIAFWAGVATAMVTFYRTRHLRTYWLSTFVSLGLFMIFASVVILLTGSGYERNSVGFQGLLTHPQTFGPVMGSVAALLTGLVIMRGERRWYIVLGASLAWVGIFMSLARTSLLGTVLAFFLTVAAGGLRGFQWWPRVRQSLLHPVAFLFYVAAIGLALIQWDMVQTQLESFLIKRDTEGQTIIEALESSRGVLIAESYENFKSNPLTGIGFGVPSRPDRTDIVEGFLGYPIAAPTEKGFMPTAVLEETGLTGAIVVLWMLVMLVRPIWRADQPTYLWLTLVALLINLGEMVFFSVGGMGMYFWLLMAFAHTSFAGPHDEPGGS